MKKFVEFTTKTFYNSSARRVLVDVDNILLIIETPNNFTTITFKIGKNIDVIETYDQVIKLLN